MFTFRQLTFPTLFFGQLKLVIFDGQCKIPKQTAMQFIRCMVCTQTHDAVVFHKQDVLSRCNGQTNGVKNDNSKVTLYSFLHFLHSSLTEHPFSKCRTPTGFTKSGPQLTKAISEFKTKRSNNERCTKFKTRSE